MKSEELYRRARKVIPGGVNSPVRAFGAVGGTPRFIKWACGSRMYDEDGKEYIDLMMSWGPLILGHGRKEVVERVREAVMNGTSYGSTTSLEVEMAEEIVSAVPSIEMVRMVNSGTEAAMSAIRLARAYTRRKYVVKFEGCYHGHSDSLLVSAGSGALTFGVPSSPGVPDEFASLTIVLPYNEVDAVKRTFAEKGEDIACVIVEPIAGNMGVVIPDKEFLTTLRTLTSQHASLLIFDEVITGFRVAFGGAQSLYNMDPDITCLGKIIGGGFPVGAYGGKREIMEKVSPSGPVYQAGTLSGNPIAMTAGLETIRILKRENPYEYLQMLGSKLEKGIKEVLSEKGIPHTINRVGSMMTIFFTPQQVKDLHSAKKSDTSLFAKFFNAMLDEGVYLPPSQFEAVFLSSAHTEGDIENVIESARRAISKI